MRNPIAIVLFLLTGMLCQAADASGKLVVGSIPAAWKEVEEHMPPGMPQLETLRFVPRDNRNASFLISYVGRGRVTDLPGLKSLHELSCRRFATGPNQHYETREIKLPHGRGVYSVFEDPDLIGKPPIRENYKFTAPIEILFDSGVIAHATIFTDERAGHTFDEAMAICLSCDVKPEAPTAAAGAPTTSAPPASAPSADMAVISVPGTDASLLIPKQGLSRGPVAPNAGNSYFSFVTAEGMMISGWLEDASKYPGFRRLWETDKAKMEEGMGVKLQDEKLDMISGWQAVSYRVKMADNFEQWNLRACRTSGHTWFDVHLSCVDPAKGIEALKALLKKMVVQPKTAGGAI